MSGPIKTSTSIYIISESTLSRVCGTHGEIVKFMTYSTDGKFYSLPAVLSRVLPDVTSDPMGSLRLMERKRAFTTCSRTRFDWKQ